MNKSLWCFAHGSDAGGWEAICVDLDIAVEGRTFEEVRRGLEGAVRSYVEDALNEAPADRDRLLNRSAPLHVRLGCWLRLAIHAMTRRRSDDDLRAGFDLPCHA